MRGFLDPFVLNTSNIWSLNNLKENYHIKLVPCVCFGEEQIVFWEVWSAVPYIDTLDIFETSIMHFLFHRNIYSLINYDNHIHGSWSCAWSSERQRGGGSTCHWSFSQVRCFCEIKALISYEVCLVTVFEACIFITKFLFKLRFNYSMELLGKSNNLHALLSKLASVCHCVSITVEVLIQKKKVIV